jgi:hypothetical protein
MISRIDVAIRCPAGQYDIRFFGGPVARLISSGGPSSNSIVFVSGILYIPSHQHFFLRDARLFFFY